MTERPPRTTRPPLNADLALVPLIDRPVHPDFQGRALVNPMSTPAPFPVSPLSPPVEIFEGQLRTLPKLQSATAVYFNDSLKTLAEGYGRKYISPHVPAPKPRIIAPPVTVKVPPLYVALVQVGIKHNVSGNTATVIIPLRLPYRPFASQILRTLWVNSQRVQTFAKKWDASRIRYFTSFS
ncbi:hypothetical protein DFH09DRAFT_1328063 [Mycena vulgaris]|nr:hypothetical protein DFH09DRAFT_1328063 [Mycena vulgaris]